MNTLQMKTRQTYLAAAVFVAQAAIVPVHAEPISQTDYKVPEGLIDTGVMGGVPCPSAQELTKMQHSQYVLHARDGKLSKVPVEKIVLPGDPKNHPQHANVTLLSDGTLYVKQSTVFLKSTDGGRSWTSHPFKEAEGQWAPLDDGTFIRIVKNEYTTDPAAPAQVFRSRDFGGTWQKISEIEMPKGWHFPGVGSIPYQRTGVTTIPVIRLRNGTLLCNIVVRNMKWTEDGRTIISGTNTPVAYRSTDEGLTWEGPSNPVIDYTGSEGGIVETASGKLLAALRYQRPLLPTESPDRTWETTGAIPPHGNRRTAKFPGNITPYKHVFLADSEDEGRTWKNVRQLTVVFGQCYPYPAALSDGTVVVVHDTRYGPGVPSTRAMISRDEGQSWQDEVYYLAYGKGMSGYTQSVVLDDDTIVTVSGTSDRTDGDGSYTSWYGHTDWTVIRWRPVE